MYRLLYIPVVDRVSLDNNVGFLEFFRLSEYLRLKGEDVYWYVVVPSWVKDGLRAHDRMQYVYIDNTRDRVINDIVGFPACELAKYFARRGGKFIIDGILSNCVHFSAYLSKLLSDPESKFFVPVILRDMFMDGGKLSSVDPSEALHLSSNYVLSHVGVVSDAERKVLSDFVRISSNAVMSRLFAERSITWPATFSFSEPRSGSESELKEQEGDRPVLFCGGDFRLTKYKKQELALARALYRAELVYVWLSSRSSSSIIERAVPNDHDGASKDLAFISSYRPAMNLREYTGMLGLPQMFVSVMDAVHVREAEEEISRLMHGQIGVFPYLSWARDRLGDDYPFYYTAENMEEAFTMAEWVALHYEDACRIASPFMSSLRTAYKPDVVHDLVWEQVRPILDSCFQTERRWMSTEDTLRLTDSLERDGRLSLDVLLDVLEEHLTYLKPWGRKGALKSFGNVPKELPTLYDIRWHLKQAGWKDLCDGPDIYLGC